ncbi:MAG: response regulator [Elusimicrobia bacterium]|nr:response regulator [Elusimicrobiota bacterium]
MPKIIVVDDDEIVGNLTLDLVTGMGIEAELIQESYTAFDAIKAKQPELVILDILMPGIDGLTLCHQVKSEPTTQHIKVVMVSGKAFAEEIDRAKQYGASLLIKKPYDVMSFGQQIKALLGGPAPKFDAPVPILRDFTPPQQAVMSATVWGCRSLSPHTTAMNSHYGFQTSCLSLEVGGNLLIFDAGTGIISLGADMAARKDLQEVWLFLSHFHQDHVQGLAFLPCLRQNGFKVNIAGANDPDKTLEQLVRECFDRYPSTVKDPFVADLELYAIQEDSYEMLPEVNLTSFYANHPSTTLGFSIEAQGRKFVYCPDSELYGEYATALQDYDEKLGGLVAGADLLVHNGRFTDGDYKSRMNNGHSSFVSALDFAARHDIKRLLLWHHDDQYSDETLDKIGDQAVEMAFKKGYTVECLMARAGMKFSI